MPAFEYAIDVAAPAEAAFRLTQDYARRLDWDPFLREARLIDGATEAAVGVRAWCVARRTGLGMETEYVSFDPPRRTAVRMTRGPWFLRRFAGSWLFAPSARGGSTRVTFRYALTTRPRWLHPLIAAIFARDTRMRLEALKAALERPPTAAARL